MIDTTKLTPEWLAGFFDGEGSVTFTSDQSLQVVLSQSRQDILEAIAQYFNSGVVKVIHRGAKKPECTLRWCGKNAAKVLSALLPHLIIKRRQAEIGIRMAELMVGKNSHYPVPAEIKLERDLLIAENRKLNDSHWSRRPKAQEEYTN